MSRRNKELSLMRRGIKFVLMAAVVALVYAPTQARADGFVSPWVGAEWAKIDNPDAGRFSLGASGGFMGAGVFGGEFDFGVSPSYFGSQNDFGSNSVITAMANVIVGVPIGGTSGHGVRPYASGGLGLIRTQVDGGNLALVSSHNNDLGWNAGAGVMGFFSDHVGLRGDVRYFQDTNADPGGDYLHNLHFWRASIGVAFR
jgi:Outer membrane protein beta-barrel domain